MKRNKKTVILAHEDLTPLTEHILAKMGEEGRIIRRRLKAFYRERSSVKGAPLQEPLKEQVMEAAN
ncbi:MAG: hypothetical protein JRI59_07720 [Deltaproteobacteria bacterium]|nr:hypothetical protein [Deltaproteobacteria bacterium]